MVAAAAVVVVVLLAGGNGDGEWPSKLESSADGDKGMSVEAAAEARGNKVESSASMLTDVRTDAADERWLVAEEAGAEIGRAEAASAGVAVAVAGVTATGDTGALGPPNIRSSNRFSESNVARKFSSLTFKGAAASWASVAASADWDTSGRTRAEVAAMEPLRVAEGCTADVAAALDVVAVPPLLLLIGLEAFALAWAGAVILGAP